MNNPKPEQPRKRPGKSGLANETRPGLGTRVTGGGTDPASVQEAGEQNLETVGDATPPLHEEPPPAPNEQDSNSLAQEQQRSTGVSGHSSAT